MPGLLQRGEDDPVIGVNTDGSGRIVLVCEHAGRAIPAVLGTLGLSAEDLQRHIAWDIGAEAVSRGLSKRFDAALILQRYSRLVYDCNRPFVSPAAIPATSEATAIPGNQGLSADARQARYEAVYQPFHDRVAGVLKTRMDGGPPPVVVSMHSFTPVFHGKPRTVELGILHDKDRSFADLVLAAAVRRLKGVEVRRNEPYGPRDGVTHTIDVHGQAVGLAHVMIEIRNDLINDEAGCGRWIDHLDGVLRDAVAGLDASWPAKL